MNTSDVNDPVARFVLQLAQRIFGRNRTINLTIIALIILALWVVFTGLFRVEVDEISVIQRFGKYSRQVGPGLQFKLPNGIEHRTNVKVQYIFKEEFGMRTREAGKKTVYAPERQYLDEALMLTGDLNCAVVPWIVQFRISDPRLFLFEVKDVPGTLRDMAEATMRLAVGDRSINEVLGKRMEIADEVKVLLQEAMSEAKTGVTIVNVELKNTTVPETVQPSFNEVNQAEQERERMINDARADFNRMIPAARGDARKIVSEAEGYALNRVNAAQGDSARFISLYTEYVRARGVTRRRLYLETLHDVLPKMGSKYLVDSDQKGVLPLLNLDKGGAR